MPPPHRRRLLGVPPFIVDKIFAHARTYTPQALALATQRLAAADRAIKGDLTLQQDDGTPLKMNLSLEASYSFDANNMLVFKALITLRKWSVRSSREGDFS